MTNQFYTERQKKLITSSGRRSLKSTLSKLIIFGHKKALILLTKNIYKKTRFSCVGKEKNAVKSRQIIFRKSQKLLTEWALSELHGASLFRTFNSYSFNFNGGLRKRRTGFCLLRTPSPKGKEFLWFLKVYLLRFHRIYLLFDWSKLFFFQMCLLRINLPNLCPNKIHVDALDFSEWHSEVVISFFWRSVYLYSWNKPVQSHNLCAWPDKDHSYQTWKIAIAIAPILHKLSYRLCHV